MQASGPRSAFGARGAETLAARRQEQRDETARLHTLRAAGVQDDSQYAPMDWDAPRECSRVRARDAWLPLACGDRLVR